MNCYVIMHVIVSVCIFNNNFNKIHVYMDNRINQWIRGSMDHGTTDPNHPISGFVVPWTIEPQNQSVDSWFHGVNG